MPDFLKEANKNVDVVFAAGRENPLGAVERPLDVYSRCWCESGVKWKFCHKDRQRQSRMSAPELQALRVKHYLVGECLHPAASTEACSSIKPIQSHTIQRKGGLSAIAEAGHVYSAQKGFSEVLKKGGQVDMTKMGVGKASTFPGFCGHHDTEMFKPVETVGARLDPWNAFLLSFRAVSYELATKRSALAAVTELRNYADRGDDFDVQSTLQNYLFMTQVGTMLGVQSIESWKAAYDQAFLKRDLAGFRMYGVTFNAVLPFVVSGAFMPLYDFEGQQLQVLNPKAVPSQLALNVTMLGETTCAVFCWTDGDDSPAARLVSSFRAIADDDKADALLVLAFEHLQNLFCTPSWWEELSTTVSDRLHRNMAGGMMSRGADGLVSPEIGALPFKVERIMEHQGAREAPPV